MPENLLCFGDNANFRREHDRPHRRCPHTPPRVLGETFKEGPKHRKKDGKQLTLET